MPNCIITVHGVGEALPGSTIAPIRDCAGALGCYPDLGGASFTLLVPVTKKAPILLEMNWAEIIRPRRSWPGLAGFGLKLCVSSVYSSARWGNVVPAGGSPLALLPWVFGVLVVWSPWFAIQVMCLESLRDWTWWLAAVAGPAVPIALTRICWRWGIKELSVGCVIWATIAAVASAALGFNPGKYGEAFAAASAVSYSAATCALAAVLMSCAVQMFTRRIPLDQKLARFALAYGPVAAFTIIGSIVWAISLGLVSSRPAGISQPWARTYLAYLGYDLSLVEKLMTIAVGGIGVALLLAVVAYQVVRSGCKSARSGEVARNGLWVVLIISPIALTVPSIVLLAQVLAALMWNSPANTGLSAQAILGVYAVSATRAIPFLPLLVEPLAIVSQVIADILFYITPGNLPFAPRKRLHARLEKLIDYAHRLGAERIVILSHSQGSVIARECATTSTDPSVVLITMGSPIDSVYRRFLGWPWQVGGRARPVRSRWINFWRASDYVGGRVAGARNRRLGSFGHTGYWGDSAVLKFVSRYL